LSKILKLPELTSKGTAQQFVGWFAPTRLLFGLVPRSGLVFGQRGKSASLGYVTNEEREAWQRETFWSARSGREQRERGKGLRKAREGGSV